MKYTYSTILFSKKVLAFPLIFAYTFFVSANSVHAGYWGESMAAAMYTQVQEELSKNLRGAITGAFKQAVGQIMNTRISMMIGGGNGQGPMFIANWETFLVADPTNVANAYLNDFFSMSTEGRNLSSSYRPVTDAVVSGSTCSYGSRSGTMGSSGACILDTTGKAAAALTSDQRSWFAREGIVSTVNAATVAQSPQSSVGTNTTNTNSVNSSGSGNYYKDKTDAAKKVINPDMPTLKLPEYGSPDKTLAGDWRGMGPLIDDMGYSLQVKTLYQNKLAQEQNKAAIQAVAYQGFKALSAKDGTVKTPGITIGALVNKVQGFNVDTISSAQDWGQLISSGVSAAATMAINSAVQVGLNAATNAVQNGVNKATGAISKATGGMVNVGVSSGGSLANVDWNNSGSGQPSEFSGSNATNTNSVTDTSSTAGQGSYSTLDTSNFQGISQISNQSYQSSDGTMMQNHPYSSPSAADTTWTTPTTPQSNDPTWVPAITDFHRVK